MSPRPMPHTGADPGVRRARRAVMAQFVLFGVIGASWLSRLPAVRDDLGIGSLQLGSLLIVGGAGSLLGALVIGTVVGRIGTRRTLAIATGANVVGFALVAWGVMTGGVGLFAAGAVVNGLCGAFVNVPINVNAAAAERRVGRAILPHFHAGFSIGAAAGAGVAAGFAALRIDVGPQLLVVVAAVTAVRLLTLRAATSLAEPAGSPAVRPRAAAGPDTRTGSAPRRGDAARAALAAWREPRTLLLGVVLLAASLAEGSAGNWLAIAVHDGFRVDEALAAAAYGSFVAAMTVFRFLGTRLIDRFGRVAVLRASGASAFAGVVLFVVAPGLPLAWVGILLWGCGTALGNPVAVAAASDDPARAPQRVSVVTSFSTISSLAAPPLLGLLADAVGTRQALLVIAAVTIVSLAAAGVVRPRAGASAAGPAAVADSPLTGSIPVASDAISIATTGATQLPDEDLAEGGTHQRE